MCNRRWNVLFRDRPKCSCQDRDIDKLKSPGQELSDPDLKEMGKSSFSNFQTVKNS